MKYKGCEEVQSCGVKWELCLRVQCEVNPIYRQVGEGRF